MNTSYAKVRDQLNQKGCGFCLAKWTQVTMHLGVGLTHSCHHPVQHKIPLAELKRNPSALHNIRYKKLITTLIYKNNFEKTLEINVVN